jgi:hypothetical protein
LNFSFFFKITIVFTTVGASGSFGFLSSLCLYVLVFEHFIVIEIHLFGSLELSGLFSFVGFL